MEKVSINPAEQVTEQISVKEKWQIARGHFATKKGEFRNYLRRQGIWGESTYPEMTEMILSRKDLTDDEKVSITEEIRKQSLELAKVAMKDDANLYEGIKILTSLNEFDLIKQRIDCGHRMNIGELSYDLAMATLEYGTDEQSEAMLRDWLKERGQTNLTDFEDTKYFRERLFIINNSFNAFANAHGLPDKLPDMTFEGSKAAFINAAMELKKKNYTVAIGVLKSGVYLAELLDYLGQNTRYIEWHRDWKRKPVWKKIGSNHDDIHSASRILLCEQDIHTGKTLDNLKPFIDELKPDKVDVSFWIDVHREIENYFETQDFYDEHFLVKKTPTEHFIENLNAVVEYAKQDKTRLLI